MSEDLKVLIECDHRVLDERLFIDLRDLKTVRFPYPISNSNVEVRVNGYRLDTEDERLLGPYSYVSQSPEGISVNNIYDDEESVAPKTQKLVFNFTVSPDDLIQVSYTAPLGYCRKCFGTGLVYDYQIAPLGFTKVTGLTKLRQDCVKAIITSLGSNIFHPWVGTSIESIIGLKYSETLTLELKREFGNVLSNLRNIQIQQSTYQTVTPDELLASVDDITIAFADYDPTLLLIEIIITSGSGQTIAVSQAFKSTGSITGLIDA